MAVNEDLLKDTSAVSEDGNFFIVTITDLDPDISYPIQLRWKNKDGSFSDWSAVKTLPTISSIEPPANPSVPTVTPVLGAIEVSWDGKTSTGGNQTNQSDYAKIYIGTTSNFTPTDDGPSANYVDLLDFANKKNSVYIGVESVVNDSLTIAYDTNYYIKIIAYNSKNEKSDAVAASGNPVQVGKVSNSGIIEITADKLRTGTLNANASITVGSSSGKHVKISGSGDPLLIYGSGGINAGAKLAFTSAGDLKITGTIYAEDGYFGKSGQEMKIGYGVNGSDYHGIYMGTNNYWYNTGSFKVGTTNQYLSWNGEILELASKKMVLKVADLNYPGYIRLDEAPENYGRLTISPPSDNNPDTSKSLIPSIDMFSNPGSGQGGSMFLNSPGNINITATTTAISGNLSIDSVGWSNDSGTTNNPSVRLVSSTAGGTLNNSFGIITSGAYGTNAPPDTIGSNGDFLFST